jgi:hypothetical protein
MHQILKFTPALYVSCRIKFTCSSIPVLLENFPQTCMTYTSAECTVNKLLMMGTGTAPKHVEFQAGVILGNCYIWLALL